MVLELLEGKTVNLRVVEKEDLPLLADWNSNSEYYGWEFMCLSQQSKTEWEKRYDNLTADTKWFLVEKKDGTKIGEIGHLMFGKLLEIYYYLVASERRKGYGTEAIMIMVDYLFLSRELMRVQATTDVSNIASQRVLEKAGFTKEGIIRKSGFNRGKWCDDCLYSILREEWKEPKILTRTA